VTIQTKRSTTIEDVARVAGVSRAAVSKVIRDAYGVSPEMRARVESAIEELSYRPRASARAMRGSSYTIGVEIPQMDNQFFPKIINGAAAALAGTQYQLIIAPAGPHHDQGPAAIEVLADRQVDGIVAISSGVAPEWLENLGRSVPLVMIGRHHESVNYDTLVGDDLLGAELAVRHLFDLGHRRIVHLTLAENGPDTQPGTPHGMRVLAYRQTMHDLGLEPEIIWAAMSPDVVLDRIQRLLSTAKGEPVGIFAAHDDMALEVLRIATELGLGPGQVSVVGYDDTEIAAHPMISLTTVNQSGTQMGAIGVRLLLERIAGRTEAAHEVLTPKIMVRNSTAAPARPVPRDVGNSARKPKQQTHQVDGQSRPAPQARR